MVADAIGTGKANDAACVSGLPAGDCSDQTQRLEGHNRQTHLSMSRFATKMQCHIPREYSREDNSLQNRTRTRRMSEASTDIRLNLEPARPRSVQSVNEIVFLAKPS